MPDIFPYDLGPAPDSRTPTPPPSPPEGEYAIEFGGGTGIGAWGGISAEYTVNGGCPDGSKCWDVLVSLDVHVGVIYGLKGKVGAFRVEAAFTGPNINAEWDNTFSRNCEGVDFHGRYEIAPSLDIPFKVNAEVGVGPFVLGVNFDAEVDLRAYIDVTVTDDGTRVAVEAGAATMGGYGFGLYKPGKRGNIAIANLAFAGTLDTPEDPKPKIILEKFFPAPAP